MNSTKTIWSSRRLRAAVLAGCVLAGALAGTASAQPGSPVGDWDVRVTGGSQGVAFLHFESDFTLHGWEVITRHVAPVSSDLSDLRGNTGRGGDGSATSSTSVSFFFFGYTPLTGAWNFATSGRLVGNLSEVDGGSSFSFNGVAHPGRNLVLNATESPNPTGLDHNVRHITWNGVPLASVPLGVVSTPADLSGTWVAQGSVTSFGTNGAASSQAFTELLTLKSLTGGDPTGFFTDLASSPFAAQSYVITGTGPGYTNVGLALQSAKKRISVVLREGDFTGSNTLLRAVEGPLNTKNASNFNATATGTDDNLSSVRYRLRRTVVE